VRGAIAFVAPPFAGHLYPLLPLAAAARAAGHRVEVLTGPAKLGAVRASGLPAHALASLGGPGAEAVADTARRVGSNPLRLAAQMRGALRLLVPVRDELAARWRAERPALVVADFAAVPAGLAATLLGIPWVTTLQAPFILETGAGPPGYLGGWRPLPGALGRARDAAGWALLRGAKGALARAFARELGAAGLARRLRADGSEAIYSPLAVLSLSLRELEWGQAWPETLRFLGPVTEAPETLPPLALPPSPRVLVTLGTHLPWAKRDLVEAAGRLAARLPGVGVVVSMGDAARASHRPERVGGVAVFPFVPYAAELGRFDAVAHHGGAGVTAAAIAAGRPALVCPQDFDQFDWAARVVHHGLGARVRRLDGPAAAEALAGLLAHGTPGAARLQRAALAYRPREAFVGLVESLLATGRLPDQA
jgi:UDP:flavonoid glycosyltransferase YjiC (YdhE family)